MNPIMQHNQINQYPKKSFISFLPSFPTKEFARTLSLTRLWCPHPVGSPMRPPFQYPWVLPASGADPRHTVFLRRRGTSSSSRTRLVTPVTTIVRPVVWFLLIILPPKMMMRMDMIRELMVAFRPFTLILRGFKLISRGLKF
jgi:hypothetical protein